MPALLNSDPVDLSRLKIMILSTPKTGNTWLRWLMYYAYGTRIVDDFPNEWDNDYAARLPDAFVSHQHYAPSPDLVRWLIDHRVVVLTTVRHPGDAFLSLFHFVKWQYDPSDEHVLRLRSDGETPGACAGDYLRIPYPQIYSQSMIWERLGALVVRYEDLLADPHAELRRICARIAPVPEARLAAAALLCKPQLLTRSGQLDRRHLRTATSQRWAFELNEQHVSLLAGTEPFKSACKRYGYNWDASASAPIPFDYDRLDPFRGADTFDNGEAVTPSLIRIYLLHAKDATSRWPDPTVTAGDSFWNWLLSPCEAASETAQDPAVPLTNAMWCTHEMRADLQRAYPDPANADRLGFVRWFVGQAHVELALPWALVSPVQEAYAAVLMAQQRESDGSPLSADGCEYAEDAQPAGA